jgi:L-fuculose-phosphate aldolase
MSDGGSLLRFGRDASETTLRAAVVEAGRVLYERELLMSSDGNLSVRLGDDHLLITPSGLCKGRLAPQDLLVIDLEGRVQEPAADPALQSTSETPMHLEAYRQRPDIRAAIHAHPPHATALTVAGRELRNDLLPEVVIALGAIPTTQYALASSQEDADAVQTLIRDHDAVMIRQHGSLTVGRDLDEALINLERLEHAATVQWLAESLGRVTPLPGPMMEQLWAMHRRRIENRGRR